MATDAEQPTPADASRRATLPPRVPRARPEPAGPRWSYALVALAAIATVVLATVSVVRQSLDPGERGGAGVAQAGERAHSPTLPRKVTVRRDDTFATIAARTGISVDELAARNPLVDPSALRAGQRLNLRPDRKSVEGRVGPKWHSVRQGDSFASIAARTGRSIDRLRELNPKLAPTNLAVGDRVRLR